MGWYTTETVNLNENQVLDLSSTTRVNPARVFAPLTLNQGSKVILRSNSSIVVHHHQVSVTSNTKPFQYEFNSDDINYLKWKYPGYIFNEYLLNIGAPDDKPVLNNPTVGVPSCAPFTAEFRTFNTSILNGTYAPSSFTQSFGSYITYSNQTCPPPSTPAPVVMPPSPSGAPHPSPAPPPAPFGPNAIPHPARMRAGTIVLISVSVVLGSALVGVAIFGVVRWLRWRKTGLLDEADETSGLLHVQHH